MIEKEKFIELISDYNNTNDTLDTLESILGFGVFESTIVQSYWKLFDEVLKSNFIEEAVDTILWWITEGGRQMWDANHEPITLDTIDDLWNYVKDFRI